MPLTVRQKFEAFHAANPHVYHWYKRFAAELIQAGVKRLSSKAIIERIRWEATITTTGAGWNIGRGKPFLIDNRFTPYYARKLAGDFPNIGKLFEMRELRTP